MSTARQINGHDKGEPSLFESQLLNPTQAANLLGISDRTLRRRAEEWGIPRIMIGSNADGTPRYRYSLASLARWAKEREVS